MTHTEELATRWSAVMMGNYKTPPVALARGAGATVWDVDGREYTDLLGGIATTILGHAHPAVVHAITAQAQLLGHVSNLAMHEPGVLLAERLLELAGRPGRVFFCNSGAEANEAAFKLSRLTGRPEVVTAIGSFHGRTMGSLALTGQPAKAAAFAPLPGGVQHVPYGDADALSATVGEQTAMVLLEPMLGEGGVLPAPPGYLAAAAETARAAGALFAVDEVQTGSGRTGQWFAHQSDGLQPDVVTLAKALGGGLPLGATLAFGAAADLMTAGSHGSTFGGNPIVAAAALAVLDTIRDEGLLERAKEIEHRVAAGVDALGHEGISGVRGRGALLGVVLTAPVAAAVETHLRAAGFLVNGVAADVVRLAPPLVVTDAQLDAFVAALPAALDAALRDADQ
ncbi:MULTISPECIES: acetylornithine transaminase [unclassified Modestobacter]|uniref:acetylornithine transaminase n=1 Tax=unclassified Modestobacter TaxID=2643866 RepID=UPI0022AA2BB1|nr:MULTISPECIES: acetylornithine transaminase [unclassified Modestobacter]MCZ2812713.1 acetylornithine transaminase [Modestobacter sp. VKM Ac-2979]MCZ2843258.1 acetylornithine transaminase [Modestobacter sp. VKM Ac-2980]MCZ2850949.1 acetylornithine transaminase [Modestobacter sp. VKM Ac-2978]